MSVIELNPNKLLGFKIIADGESTVRLTSPKIGEKDQSISQVVGTDPLSAKIGLRDD